MKVIIACGGTGGHIYPALAVAEELKKRGETQLSFLVGEEGLEEKIINREGYACRSVKARGLRRKLSYKALSAPWVTLVGLFQSFFVLRKIRPQVLLATGGYLSFPVVLSAALLRIPVLLLEPNAVLGFANRALLPFVECVALAFEETKERYKNPKMVVTGNPVRKKILEAKKEQAVCDLKLDPQKKTVLVFGGSQGSRKINQIIVELLPLLKGANFQLLHIAGERDYAWVKAKLAPEPVGNYRVFDYAFDISTFYAASDLVISRAGATAIAEILGRGLPSLLIPFPHAAEDHQSLNARILGQKGAADILCEKELGAKKLYAAINNILESSGRQRSMQKAAEGLNKKEAAEAVGSLLLQLAGGK